MKTKHQKPRNNRKSRRSGAESIMRGIRQIQAMMRDDRDPSEQFTVRTVELPDRPAEYSAADVRKLRNVLHASQPVFASLIGASIVLVQGWEQGKRKPNPMACRLLEEIERDPARWIARLRRGSAA